MSVAEFERLKADIATDGALRERLAPVLETKLDATAAVALFQANGYQIEAADLMPVSGATPVALSDAALDEVSAAGWWDTLKNIGSTAQPYVGKIAGGIL